MRLSGRGKKSREMEGVMKNKKQEECVFKAALRQRARVIAMSLGCHMVRDIINY